MVAQISERGIGPQALDVDDVRSKLHQRLSYPPAELESSGTGGFVGMRLRTPGARGARIGRIFDADHMNVDRASSRQGLCEIWYGRSETSRCRGEGGSHQDQFAQLPTRRSSRYDRNPLETFFHAQSNFDILVISPDLPAAMAARSVRLSIPDFP